MQERANYNKCGKSKYREEHVKAALNALALTITLLDKYLSDD
jgi:hypothetical protein